MIGRPGRLFETPGLVSYARELMALEDLFVTRQAWRKHKAWGVSPRDTRG